MLDGTMPRWTSTPTLDADVDEPWHSDQAFQDLQNTEPTRLRHQHASLELFACTGLRLHWQLLWVQTSLFKPSELKFKDLIKKYGVKKVIQAHNLRHRAVFNGEKPAKAQESKGVSLLEVAAQSRAQAKATAKGAAGGCEVCVYVVENKQMHQPFLCRGLKDPAYQQTCVTTLISLMWWLENQVYWINYGCQRDSGSGQWEWVKPCPAHAVCSWIQKFYERQPICPPDAKYRKPS